MAAKRKPRSAMAKATTAWRKKSGLPSLTSVKKAKRKLK